MSVAAAGAPTLCVYFIPKGVRCALHAIKQHRHWIDDYCRRMCVYIEDRTVQSVPDQSINQSKFLTKSHTGRGEATSLQDYAYEKYKCSKLACAGHTPAASRVPASEKTLILPEAEAEVEVEESARETTKEGEDVMRGSPSLLSYTVSYSEWCARCSEFQKRKTHTHTATTAHLCAQTANTHTTTILLHKQNSFIYVPQVFVCPSPPVRLHPPRYYKATIFGFPSTVASEYRSSPTATAGPWAPPCAGRHRPAGQRLSERPPTKRRVTYQPTTTTRSSRMNLSTRPIFVRQTATATIGQCRQEWNKSLWY